MILLNPGPVNLTERVRAALTLPDLCHREREFGDLQDEIRRRLLEIYSLPTENWAPVLVSGSGTAAVEAMLVSLMPRDGRLLVIENGVYGARLADIAGCHGITHTVARQEWGTQVDLDALARHLDAQQGFTHVAVVQHETSTGRLNDVAAVSRLCRERDIALVVDAVSSFGAEALEFDAWGVTACAASANKCLHGAPGMSFVILRRDALPVGGAGRSVYLDLARHCRAQDACDTAFTPAVPIFYALREALREFQDQGGWRMRHERYRRLAEAVEEGLVRLGVAPLLREGERSVVLRAYHLPDGLDYAALHDGLKRRGFVIYAGQGKLAASIFRVSTMGAIDAADMQRFLDAVSGLLGPALHRGAQAR
ncbi:MAG TPA: 2-aminoethylphosphonate aminotransferase [Burkholderiales bacterium]|nr:2-aminoethylphosphonate aminotransferase [Burkholderiales bacterium]